LLFLYSSFASGGNIEVYTAPPFVTDLWPDEGPAGRSGVIDGAPLSLIAARGETESLLIAIRALKPLKRVIVENPDFGSGITSNTRAIMSVKRATVYSSMAGLRYPGRYDRTGGMLLPDILHPDEEAVLTAARQWTGEVPPPEVTGRATFGFTGKNGWKYMLLTVTVPESVPAGLYKSSVLFISEGSEYPVPVHLTVRPFILERNHGKLIGISNEFCDPGHPLVVESLEMMQDIGLTFTRIAPVTSRPDASRWFNELRRHNIKVISQNRTPRQASELRAVPPDFRFFFYGVDEPQPKDREGKDWRKMAEHVRLSERVKQMGGLIMTSLPYSLSMELRDRNSRLYREVAKLGVTGVFAPLDWANMGLGVQQLGRDRRPESSNRDFYSYVSALQEEFYTSSWQAGEVSPRGKHPWVETYYFPHGLSRYGCFGRLLFGYYLFNSGLDGAMAWTMYRIQGNNPFAESNLPVATLAYPGQGEIYGTYSLESLREGIDDLCYANQAYKAVVSCLSDERTRIKGEELKKVFISAVAPYGFLVQEGKRIDLAVENIEESMQRAREVLSRIIIEAGSL